MALPDFNTASQLYFEWSQRGLSDQEIQNIIAFHQAGGSSGSSVTASSTPLVRYERPAGSGNYGFGLYDGDADQITPIGGGVAFAAGTAAIASEEDFEIVLIRAAIATTTRGTDYDQGDTLAQFLLQDNEGNSSTYWRNVDPDEDNIIPAPDKAHLTPISVEAQNTFVSELPFLYTVGTGPETEGIRRAYYDTSTNPPTLIGESVFDLAGTEVTGATIVRSVQSAVLAQLKADQVIAPQLWTDDTGNFYYRQAAYDEDNNQFVFVDVDLAGAAYTPGANPRPFGGEETPDKDVQLVAATYDAGGNADLNGFVQLLYDHGTNPTTVTQLGVLDSSYAPVASPTNVRERTVKNDAPVIKDWKVLVSHGTWSRGNTAREIIVDDVSTWENLELSTTQNPLSPDRANLVPLEAMSLGRDATAISVDQTITLANANFTPVPARANGAFLTGFSLIFEKPTTVRISANGSLFATYKNPQTLDISFEEPIYLEKSTTANVNTGTIRIQTTSATDDLPNTITGSMRVVNR